MVRYRRVASGIAVLLAMGLAPITAQAQPAHPRRVALFVDRARVRPAMIGYWPNSDVDHLVWSKWGPDKAVGRGSYSYCYTGCGPGSTGPQRSKTLPATVTLSDPLDTSDGWLFNLVTVAVKNRKPFGLAVVTGGMTPGSLVILPTAANLTGNYLWGTGVSAGTSQYVWLQLVQSGIKASGSAEIGDPAGVTHYSISGVVAHGVASIVLTPTSSSTGSYSLVLHLDDIDLRTDSSLGNLVLVPASWNSYWAASRAVG